MKKKEIKLNPVQIDIKEKNPMYDRCFHNVVTGVPEIIVTASFVNNINPTKIIFKIEVDEAETFKEFAEMKGISKKELLKWVIENY